ncbi:MAG: SUMF1/EgtB/PvdO family nonheme iron enzyme [Verrucomicrobia bacterium]|nr:SUMF1/EgtB/PvdO family nonheme iron enzyme [Verrucomicrobiota bacterium]
MKKPNMETISRIACPALSRLLFCALFALVSATHAAPPVVSNVRAAQRAGTHLVDIFYNVSDPDGNTPLTVYVAVSDNGGTSYNVPVFALTGAVGPGVTPGNDRHIVWNAATDWPGRFNTQCRVRVIADDGTGPPAPNGMVYIPAGAFQMGDAFTEGAENELPVHIVYVSGFFVDKFEVSRELWLDVYTWAIANGYGLDQRLSDANHPVGAITWYNAVKWCNARSEKERLTPCYYTDASKTTLYRTGNLNISNDHVKWDADGYRLPTETEWEKAARGGLNGKRFPWGNTVTHSQANYGSSARYSYDISPTRGCHPTYGCFTSPVGSFAANGYGLYDMAGNVWEWCWDSYDSTYYGQPSATGDDPRGPATVMPSRVTRSGGSQQDGAFNSRCAARSELMPLLGSVTGGQGFRCVKGGSF